LLPTYDIFNIYIFILNDMQFRVEKTKNGQQLVCLFFIVRFKFHIWSSMFTNILNRGISYYLCSAWVGETCTWIPHKSKNWLCTTAQLYSGSSFLHEFKINRDHCTYTHCGIIFNHNKNEVIPSCRKTLHIVNYP